MQMMEHTYLRCHSALIAERDSADRITRYRNAKGVMSHDTGHMTHDTRCYDMGHMTHDTRCHDTGFLETRPRNQQIPEVCRYHAGTLTSVRGMQIPCRYPDQRQRYAGIMWVP